MNNPIKLAAVIRPGFAIFAPDLLSLTVEAYEHGANLSGVWIRKATPCAETGGVYVEGGNEDKHFRGDGRLDN